jgi:hypothetical protein
MHETDYAAAVERHAAGCPDRPALTAFSLFVDVRCAYNEHYEQKDGLVNLLCFSLGAVIFASFILCVWRAELCR